MSAKNTLRRPAAATSTSPGSRNAGSKITTYLAQALQLLRSGRLEAAGQLCDAIVTLDADNREALHMGGAIALQLGQLEKGLERLGRAVAVAPDNAAALSDLGLALERAGRLVEAEARLRQALAVRPKFPEALNNLGNVLKTGERYKDARACYRRAVALRPDFPEALNNLALAELRVDRFEAALALARKAVALAPAVPVMHETLGTVLDAQGKGDEAIAVYERLVALAPNWADARHELGVIQVKYGHLTLAETNLRAAIRLDPGRIEWRGHLAYLVRHTERDDDIKQMEALYARHDLSENDRMHLAFGLGKALEELGRYEEAFDYLIEGNRIRRETVSHDRAELEAFVVALVDTFRAELFERFAGLGCKDAAPVFIVGMPRSGTTLVEQVLAGHPAIRTAGEQPWMTRIANSLQGQGGRWWLSDLGGRLAPDLLSRLGRRYQAMMRAFVPQGRLVTDKMPANFMFLGLIRLILPNARLIYCRRDPVDNGLSIFKNYFNADGMSYAYDLGDIGHFYRQHEVVMDHWRKVSPPGLIHEVRYESMVADFEPAVRAMLGHLGLEWNEGCRAFYRAAGPVLTASSVQVRQPLYSRSVGSAARYGDRLRPLTAALEADPVGA